MKCKACGAVQREPVIMYPHYRRVEFAINETDAIDFNVAAYWACDLCDRKHNQDGSLYQPSGN